MAANTGTRTLETALKANPATQALGVYQGDDLVKRVPMRSGRNRVSLTMQVVERLTWSRIELLDRKDGLLAVVDNDGAPGPMEDITSATEAREARRDERLLRLLLEGQRVALSHRLEESRSISDAMVRCMTTMTQAVRSLADIYREQAEVAGEMGAAEAALAQRERELAEAGGGRSADPVGDAVKMAIAQKLLQGDAPPAKPES
jgi:hypothetical protein